MRFLHDPVAQGEDHEHGDAGPAGEQQPVEDFHVGAEVIVLERTISSVGVPATIESLRPCWKACPPAATVDELKSMTTEWPASVSPGAPGERVARRTMAQRRRRVIRSVLTVVLVTLVMLLLSVLSRDEQAVWGCRERMELALKTFQQHHQEWMRDPLKFPLPSIEAQLGDIWRDHVLDNWHFTEQAAFAREVGVCCCERSHSRLFRPSGRHVILFNVPEQKYELKWMDESEFARRAKELGFRAPVRQ